MSGRVEKIKKKIEKNEEVFMESVEGLSVEHLQQNILLYVNYREEASNAMKSSSEIKEMEERLKLAKKPFMDKIKEYKDKVHQLKKFTDENICKEELNKHIITYTKKEEDELIKMDNSSPVRYAKEELDMVKGPFTDAINVLKLKIAYLNILVDERQGFEPGYSEATEEELNKERDADSEE